MRIDEITINKLIDGKTTIIREEKQEDR